MPSANKINTVFGAVKDVSGRPLANLIVEIFDVDMREWLPLSGTATDREGRYSLTWGYEQLKGRNIDAADIAVKVLVPDKITELFRSSIDEVRFNASDREEINILISQAIPQTEVEFDVLVRQVSYLANQVPIADLQENKEFRDVTFLSKEMQIPAEKVEHLVVAHRLQNLSKIDAAFFYAILRRGTLLNNSFGQTLNARHSIGIQADDQLLLLDTSRVDQKLVQRDLKIAVGERLVSEEVLKNLKQYFEYLSIYKERAAGYYEKEHPKKVVRLLTSILNPSKMTGVKELFKASKGDLNGFVQQIADPAFFQSTETPGDIKLGDMISQLFALGKKSIPFIVADNNLKKEKDVQKLARFNKAKWVETLSKGNPELKESTLVKSYASAIVRKFENAFPTTAFAAQLERSETDVLNNQTELVSFFSKHEDFDLAKNNVDTYLKTKKISAKSAEPIADELKSVQRIFKLIPHYGKTIALKNENIRSAYNIVSVGEKRFVDEIAPKAGISTLEAKDIFRKAETKHTAAMLMIGDLNDSMSAMNIASLETESLADKIEAVSKDFPNLKSLFKITDSCECEHCRSVYSPAAYLVEILQFLDKRTVVAGNAKTVLFNRRPDLGEIDLGCENANTPVKYIDLVCEILEDAISPDEGIDYTGALTAGPDASKGKISATLLTALITAGLPVTAKALIHETESGMVSPATLPHYLRDSKVVCKIVNTGGNTYKIYRLRQTLSSADELDAAPEYVNAAAYSELRTQKYAFKLPFDLQHKEASAYFDRFGLGRDELMKTFQLAAGPTDFSIAAESLSLSDGEWQIITAPPITNDNAAQQVFWNVPAPGNVVDYLKQVDHFLDRTSLEYKDLELLLQLRFIKKTQNLFVYSDELTCDTATKEIRNINLDTLDRIHRFLRLQKKLGWRFETLDEVISQPALGNGALNDNCTKVIANLKKLAEKTGLKLEELIAFYGEIPHYSLPYKTTTVYDTIFQNKAKSGTVEPGISVENVTENETAAVKKTLNDFKNAISVSININESNFDRLVAALPDNILTYANLSRIFAMGKWMKKIKISAEDFFILQELSGIDAFSSPAETLAFYDATIVANALPIKLKDLKFTLNHEADNLADREIKTDKIETLLKGLQVSYQKSFNDNRSLYSSDATVETLKGILKNQLSGLTVLQEADVNILLNFVDRNWTYKWVDDGYTVHSGNTLATALTFIDDKQIASLFDITAIKVSLNTLAAAAGPNIEAEQKAWIKTWLDAISSFNFTSEKPTLLTAAIASSFKTDAAVVETVLSGAKLKKTAPGTDILIDLLLSNSLIDTADITAGHPLPLLPVVSEAAFKKQYDALRLLHKLFPLLAALKLDNGQISWFLKNNQQLGWFELDTIPYTTGQAAVSYNSFIEFSELLTLAKTLVPVTNPADPEKPVTFFSTNEALLAGGTTQDDLMQSISVLTGYEKETLISIDDYFFAAFSASNYKSIPNFLRLLESAEGMRKLSATISEIGNYIKPILSAPDVAALRTNLKSRYDEDTWLITLKEIMDKIRPQKRDALVAYLLATNPDIKNENDLYEYFLVDVEMGSCMPSSRIVLAHNCIQLFVQRCLMGIEPDAIADIDHDPNWNQWQWMKNYRVWEANRKIFLYPENWYDVTLADDKSFQLTEFINELQQNELTNDTAETSVRNYLEKLDNIAFLEVKATWYDVPTRTMHVFARTKGGDPAIYYYRRFEKERSWTAWEKVELDIQGDQVLAFIRNNRLHLSWLMFTEEAQPDQQTKVPAGTDQGTYVNTDRPAKKLVMTLAISEYSNKKWQPKRVSKDSISAPSTYTLDYSQLERDKYNMLFLKQSDQIYIFSSQNSGGIDTYEKNGVFDISGCKGYPEKSYEGSDYFPDFLPDFKDSQLRTQRYNEITTIAPDDLAVKNGVKPFDFFKLLNSTPGQFRISYPHQMTALDSLSLIYQLFTMALNVGAGTYANRKGKWKLPFGTMLPYFMEDSWHAYVVIPGFYKETTDGTSAAVTGLSDEEKRTASDLFQLLDDIANWFKKTALDFVANPPADPQAAIDRILTDPDFQAIIQEMSRYKPLQPILQFLIGNTGNPTFDEELKSALEKAGLVYGEQFKNMYHPLVCSLRAILYKEGIPGLMKRETQLSVNTNFNFKNYYNPDPLNVAKTGYKQVDGSLLYNYPIEDVDFTSDGSHSLYNWDMFYRLPLHIAGSLTKNQRFEEAMSWFGYIFNPTGALPGTGVQKYWVTKPFYLNQEADYIAQRIDSLMYATANASNPDIKELEFAIDQWRNKPFRPDVIARFRPVAYQKALLMKYIDNLTEWGDNLFRQDTMESIAQATQMYILADKLLGPKPRVVPPVVKAPYETYNQIEAKLDSFSNALIALENILPDLSVLPQGGAELPAPPVTLSLLYFCIPNNEKMLEYWDRVGDRLFKIRHCQNIDGVERSLALFAPPIDPAMLVKAAASGLDLSSILAGTNAPAPFYRFSTLAQKANELAQEVRGLGSSLLSALEKKDSEALSLLRNELEIKVLNATREIKKLQISEAAEQIEVLKRTKLVTEERHTYYQNIEKIIPKEQLNLDKLKEANDHQVAAQIVRTVAGALRLIPEFHVGASGFGGSPSVVFQLGGSAISGATSIAADILGVLSTVASFEASRAGTLGGYDRRFDDWKLQERLALKELSSIDKQIDAARIRKEISETDLKNQDLQIENARKTDEFMRSKFTNKELYDWMIGQISSVYFKSYQLTHDFAKKAERSYRLELANDDSFISYGYWDSMKKGLQSADQLIYDIKRMETSYLDKNKREYEITKHISLTQLDPLALVKLRNTGVCDFDVPEALYDLDFAGQYFRRIKSVSVSLPCIAGPYTSVSAKLSLVNNRYRKNANTAAGYEEVAGNDERFTYNVGAIQSVATSNAQNDSGLFELNFRDERYLPFEGCGAVSSWRLELPNPTVARQFNYDSLSDAILTIKYTSREGGSSLKTLAENTLTDRLEAIRQQIGSESGLHIALNMKQDMPNEWHMLKRNKTVALTISKDRLPYFVQAAGGGSIDHVRFIAKATAAVTVKVNATSVPVNGSLWGLWTGNTPNGSIESDVQFTLSIDSQAELDSLTDLVLMVKYTF